MAPPGGYVAHSVTRIKRMCLHRVHWPGTQRDLPVCVLGRYAPSNMAEERRKKKEEEEKEEKKRKRGRTFREKVPQEHCISF